MKQGFFNRLIGAVHYILMPALAYAIWYLINYFVTNVSAIVSITFFEDVSGASADELLQIERSVLQKNVSLVYTISAIIALFFFYLMYKRFNIRTISDISFRHTKTFPNVTMFLTGVVLNVFSVSLVNLLDKIIPQSWVDANSESVGAFAKGNIVFTILTIVVFAPIIEEILFRGILYNSLKKAIGQLVPVCENKVITKIIAAVITSFLFAYIHGNILQGIYTFVLSVLMIYALELTGSLITTIVIHIGFNIANMFTFFLYGKVSDIVLCIVSAILVIIAFAMVKITTGGKNERQNN